jgi:hypothetical protein
MPWDLESAVHKDTRRWVEWDYDSSGSFTTESSDDCTVRTPVRVVSDDMWDQYCVFSERIFDLTDGVLLNRWEGDYSATLNPDGTATYSSLPSGHDLKILYSTDAEISNQFLFYIQVSINQSNWDTVGNTTRLGNNLMSPMWEDSLQVDHEFNARLGYFNVTLLDNQTDWDESWSWEWTWNQTDFKVFKEMSTYASEFDDLFRPLNVTLNDNVQLVNIDWDDFAKAVISSVDETVHVYSLNHTLGLDFNAFYNATTDVLNATYRISLMVDVEESIGGRYEWVEVGRDAATVDSAGAALVAAAFKNKQVEVGNAGEDMEATEIANLIPWIMAKSGDGDMVADYQYDPAGGDYRTALKDDWCTYWPISSSNLIGVGGPLANVFAWYGNDFTDAFYGVPMFSGDRWSGDIAALTCWNKNSYASSEDTGYAVISTYKDINGSVLFLVWGHWGRDTFYASQWLHGDEAREIPPGIHQLQDAPECLTSIILEIDYSDPEHPDFSIVECLSTISEIFWEHSSYCGDEDKGGIHDP